MKVQEVVLRLWRRRSPGGKPEIIGIGDRHMRRWRERYEESAFRGLFDRGARQAFPQSPDIFIC